jgi:hypothetical protein
MSPGISKTGLNRAPRPFLLRASCSHGRSIDVSADRSHTEEAKVAADESRLIPPYNASATEPGDVYALHDIIPETEWKAISVSALINADNENKIAAMPHRRSDWVNQHLAQVFASESPNKRTL